VFFGKFSGLVGLIVQAAMACVWTYLAADGLWLYLTAAPEHKPSLIVNAVAWAIAAGTAYCIYCQYKFVREDRRFKEWLVANAEKIRNQQLAFFRSQRISMDTELVRHHLVFSAIVVSFRIQTRWIIKGTEPRMGHAICASLYTLFYGWWGFPFGLFWTPVALIKNLTGSTTVRVRDLLQPAPAKPVGFSQRFESTFSRRLHGIFFIDQKPVGVLPSDPAVKA
jgi:hypothetical protein